MYAKGEETENRRTLTVSMGGHKGGGSVFAKVFSSLWEGTLVAKPAEQLVFIFLMAHSDREGVVNKSQEAIALLTGLPLAEVFAAIANLEGVDPQSKSPELNGARLERIEEHRDWGWRIVNHDKYRALRDEEMRRLQTRDAMTRYRAKRVGGVVAEPESPPELEEAPMPGEETPRQWSQGFDSFWEHYPRKVARESARKAYMKLRPRTQETYDLIVAGLYLHMENEWKDREIDKVPHAATWLNQGRFRDAERTVAEGVV